jgi:hypothetical protein
MAVWAESSLTIIPPITRDLRVTEDSAVEEECQTTRVPAVVAEDLMAAEVEIIFSATGNGDLAVAVAHSIWGQIS